MNPPKTAAFKEVNIPQQKVVNGVLFPLVLSPESSSSASLAEAVGAHKPWVEARLKEAGAVLFRGFDTPTTSDFSDVVEAFGYDDYQFTSSAALRTHVVGRAYTSNDAPTHTAIEFHNEMSYTKDHPSKVLFYCEIEPGSEGATPIVLRHVVYERLMQKNSEFLRQIEEHGMVYYKEFANETNSSSFAGQSWKSSFSTNDKTFVEHKASEAGWKLEWLEDRLLVTMGPVAGIKTDSSRPKERKMWFNHILIALSSYRSDAGAKAVTLGDGTAIPLDIVDDCKKIMEEECVAFPWKQGDVLMLDNSAVQHSRRTFAPRVAFLLSLSSRFKLIQHRL